jgi:hypothetical protein
MGRLVAAIDVRWMQAKHAPPPRYFAHALDDVSQNRGQGEFLEVRGRPRRSRRFDTSTSLNRRVVHDRSLYLKPSSRFTFVAVTARQTARRSRRVRFRGKIPAGATKQS